jgi:CheY-like chemotaxis protein
MCAPRPHAAIPESFPHPFAVRAALMSMKLLLVDDDVLVCSAISRSLIRLGHSSRTVTSAADALTLLEAEAPNAVLTDLDLGPGSKDGIELIGELRRRGYTRPTILMTGSDLDVARARLVSAGLDDIAILAKPFELDDLLRTLGEAVASRGAAGAHRGQGGAATTSVMGNVMRALVGRVM